MRAGIPSTWVEESSTSGGGTVFRDPEHPGRQIRIMPGYPPGSRPDALTTGPYVVVSQRGTVTKVPLAGIRSVMSIDELAPWLVGEINDLLDVSSVGLYEFVWLLQSRAPELSEAEVHRIAEAALRTLVSKGDGSVVRLRWPTGELLETPDPAPLQRADWREPTAGGSYLALRRS